MDDSGQRSGCGFDGEQSIMLNSLQSRLWFTYLLLIMLILAVLGTALFIYVIRNPVVDRQALGTLNAALQLINRQLEVQDLPREQWEIFLERISQSLNIRAVLYSRAGTEIYDSQPEEPSLRAPLDGDSQGRLLDENRDPWLYTTRRMPPGGTLVLAVPRAGGLRLLRSPQLRVVLREDFFPMFFRAGILALVISLLLAAWMSQWVTSPLKEISRAAEGVSQGEYRQIPPRGPAEVRSLAAGFNQMVEQVQASQQAQRDFVANVSHDLKTPLTSIQGFSQAIQDGTVQDRGEIVNAARIISTEAGRMYRLVIELLDLARLDAGTAKIKRQAVHLESILTRVKDQLQPQAIQSGVELSLQAADLPPCAGDPDRLAQVFTNLVDNGITHTPPGGKVSLRAWSEQEQVFIEVRDTGEGIPPEDLSRIFERFYQVDKSRKQKQTAGTGLGLAIARQLIEAHNGEISVRSRPGEGTVFRVSVPVIKPGDDTAAQLDQERSA